MMFRIYHADNIEWLTTFNEGGLQLINTMKYKSFSSRDFFDPLTKAVFDVAVSDPPYGINKAGEDWDNKFQVEWYKLTKRCSSAVVIITGSAQFREVVNLVGDDYVDAIFARNLNGMTFSPIGFGNILVATVTGKIKAGKTFFEFVVKGDKPDHPSPKPLDYMLKLIERTTKEGDWVFDPFMGSGTTGVACHRLGRHFVGIECVEKYFNLAVDRLNEEDSQLKLF